MIYKERYELLSTFLLCDVTSFGEWIKSNFDKVMSGESDF